MLIILALINILLVAAIVAQAGQVVLAWDDNNSETPPDGWRIYKRTATGKYNFAKPDYVRTGTGKLCTVNNLSPSTTYFFVCRAFKVFEGVTYESPDSNEVKFISGNVPAKQSGINLSKDGEKMFLVSTPVASEEADYFEVEIDGAVVRADAQRDGDKSRLHHDLTGMTTGGHNVRIRAVNGWGVGPWSDPFAFTATLPGQVSGVGLSPD